MVPWTDAHGTFYDTDPSQMTPEAWLIFHHPVYHGNDNLVAVKAPKTWHKWNHRPNRVSMSSHITTIHSSSLTLDKGRKSEGRTYACHSMSFSTASPAIWSARSLPFTPTCDGIYIVQISYSLFFSHQQAFLISNTKEWVLGATLRVCRAFTKTHVIGHNNVDTWPQKSPTTRDHQNDIHQNRHSPRPLHHWWTISMKSQIPTSSMPLPFGKSPFQQKAVLARLIQ
jgi:hypothetical protein